ncbi:hypothetical protein V8C26DRAFT_51111 [Trichoderma gracile]
MRLTRMRPGSGFGATAHTGCHPAASTAVQWIFKGLLRGTPVVLGKGRQQGDSWREAWRNAVWFSAGKRCNIGPEQFASSSKQAGRAASCYQMHIIRVEAPMRGGDREIASPSSPFWLDLRKGGSISSRLLKGVQFGGEVAGIRLGEIGDAGPHLLTLILLALAWRSSLYAPQISLALPPSRQMPDEGHGAGSTLYKTPNTAAPLLPFRCHLVRPSPVPFAIFLTPARDTTTEQLPRTANLENGARASLAGFVRQERPRPPVIRLNRRHVRATLIIRENST